MDSPELRLAKVEERIQSACRRAVRDRSEVTLVAVSKGRSAGEIGQLYGLGLRHFGENRLPEFLHKAPELPSDIIWHFIGPLQSNKARKIAENFNVVHSVSSASCLGELAKSRRKPDLFVQVNVGREVQKSGILSEELDSFLQLALQYCPGGVCGLMTIGPQVEDPEESRRLFRELQQLARGHGLAKTSMGMSGDYEVAIEEGATHVRVGTALFGHPS